MAETKSILSRQLAGESFFSDDTLNGPHYVFERPTAWTKGEMHGGRF